MAKKVLYKQHNLTPSDTIKPIDSTLANKSFTQKTLSYNTVTQKDTLIKLIEQGYDATSYIYSIAGGPVPLSDNFLNPVYFKIYNNKTHTAKPDMLDTNSSKNTEALLTHTDYLLVSLLVLGAAIGFVRISTKNFINRLFSSVVSFSFSRIMYNDRNRLFHLNDLILLTVFYISSGIVFVAISDYLKIDALNTNNFLIYILSAFIIFLSVQLYKLVIVFLGVFVDVRKYVSEYLFYFNNILKLLAILNVIILFGILFAPENTKLLFIISIISIYLIASFLRIYKIILSFLQNGFSLFYLIMYFCALEIVPILLLGKLFLEIYQDKIAFFDILF